HGPRSARPDHGWLPSRDTRAYRDGRLDATYHVRVLPARDRATASLLYDEPAGTARPIAGGPSRAFEPCPREPQFEDGDGRVFYFDAQEREGTLWVDGRQTAFRGSSGAGWAKP
nr:hypothetical protein [Candidatus Eremiobacteraeota bacterium]